ncbi:hypothetical protein B0H10DRAFT_2188730 [Mycena sp. CBHHK59/15]|nr:hypothetical protein B0H10DRAFT_2188730 [Mycena sp. CBHHK59/15]
MQNTSKTTISISSLPSEIHDHIIDFVAVQKVKKVRGNLAACSLVCRAWTPRSRSHFFKDLRLLINYDNVDAFGELLRSPCCTILSHVRYLTMLSDDYGSRRYDELKEPLALLTGLESLRLIGRSWEVHGAAPSRGFMSSLAGVVDLEIDCRNMGEFDHALLIICAFPALRRLSIRQFAIDSPFEQRRHYSLFPPYTPYAPPAWVKPGSLLHPPHLSSLSIDAPALVPILHWLNWTGTCRVSYLELVLPSRFRSENIGPLVEYMQSLRNSLEHLKLGSSTQSLDSDGSEKVFNLNNFQNLRNVYFTNVLPKHRLGSLERSLTFAVRSICSRSLESVTFDIDRRGFPHNFKLVDWTGLDNFFSESDFPNLRHIRCTCASAVSDPKLYKDMRLATPDAYEDFVNAMRDAFPGAYSRGLLDIPLATLKSLCDQQ